MEDEMEDEMEPCHWRIVRGRPPSEWQADATRDAARCRETPRGEDASRHSGSSATVLSGVFVTGAQKHFFLETQSAFVTPAEDGKVTVWCGHQNPRRTQAQIAKALGTSLSRVDVRMRRT